jgi:UDP-N-acetylglucosamine:LPS N-acetylglucosamine transferase
VIAGGGTGGHVVPSLQIARAMVARGHSPGAIELYGSRRGQEAQLWPTLEFPFTLLSGRGIRRSLRPRALWDNAGAVIGLVGGTVAAVWSFLRSRPLVVVVVGGYASFPAGVAAVVARVPLVVVSIDAAPGAVNRVLARFAAANAVSFDGTGLPRATLTGTPIRTDFGELDGSESALRIARRTLGLPEDRFTIAVAGGSLGAHRINAAVSDLVRRWAPTREVSIYHVAGRRDYAEFAGADVQGTENVGYRLIEFEDRMPVLHAAADVFVCRAGGMTVAELLASGTPSVLVPLPGAPRDHQTRNAEAMVALGASVLVPDDSCDGDRLQKEVEAFLTHPDRLRHMGMEARRAGHLDAAERVAELVDAHAR